MSWSYGLNTQAIPTYGGEVVQVLSAYIDVLTIQGDVVDYKAMEHIYAFFIKYIYDATQTGGFDETPLEMNYPERGWRLKLQVYDLPGITMGTDVVAPQWQLSAQIVEDDPTMNQYTLAAAAANGFNFEKIHAGIGYNEQNPFSDPSVEGKLQGTTAEYDPTENLGKLADWYQKLLPAYLDGTKDFSAPSDNDFIAGLSTPTGTGAQGADAGTTQAAATKTPKPKKNK